MSQWYRTANRNEGNTLQTAASQPHGGIALYKDTVLNTLSSTKKTNSSEISKRNGGKVLMLMYHFVETAVESRTSERETCHFVPIVMTVFDGNQEIIPLTAFSSRKIVCAHKKALSLHSKRLNNE